MGVWICPDARLNVQLAPGGVWFNRTGRFQALFAFCRLNVSLYNCLTMSGHSHYATIKRQKESRDAARGNIFSKLAKAITIAARGGADPNSNFKLRVEIEKARAANMPKDNIERAIARAQAVGEALDEVTYEGFGPSGIAVIVQVATDNRNRTGQEIKNIFERAGGRLGGPGAVSFNFENKGFLLVEKSSDPQGQMLSMIDMGVEDMAESEDGIEVYISPDKLSDVRKKFEDAGYIVKEMELSMKPTSLHKLTGAKEVEKAIGFLDSLEEHDDVQKVFTNLDVPE
jgi:YebC/PmpR family DNA-binding regulatory protein